MKTRIFFVAYFFTILVNGQIILNPSFEGPPGMSVPPTNWAACGDYSTPDTQPTTQSWNFTQPASDGRTYMTLVMRGSIGAPNDNLTEGAGSKLNSPLKANTCYDFQIDLATYLGATFNTGFEQINYNNPGRLAIWGGNSPCEKSVLLWQSPVIGNENWNRYTFQVSPNKTSTYIVLEAQYADLQKKGYGNIMIDRLNVTVNNIGSLEEDQLICKGSTITLQAPNNIDQINWWSGSTESSVQVSSEGEYWAKISKGSCAILDTVRVNIISPIHFELGRDTSLCQGDILVLIAESPYSKYEWSDGSNAPNKFVSSPGTYWVKVKNQCEEAYDDINVSYRNECCQISMPNIFTPNGDEYNNEFVFSTESEIINFNLFIYNRWGEAVFQGNDLLSHWDGTSKNGEVDSGVYYWVCKITCQHKGEILENSYRGDVTVVR